MPAAAILFSHPAHHFSSFATVPVPPPRASTLSRRTSSPTHPPNKTQYRIRHSLRFSSSHGLLDSAASRFSSPSPAPTGRGTEQTLNVKPVNDELCRWLAAEGFRQGLVVGRSTSHRSADYATRSLAADPGLDLRLTVISTSRPSLKRSRIRRSIEKPDSLPRLSAEILG